MERRVKTDRCAEKLESTRVILQWDNGSIYRAKVYARLLRALIDDFGHEEKILDIAENHRRENGQFQGELNRDLVMQDKMYKENSALLIDEMDKMWHSSGADWGYTCKCVYVSKPEDRMHHLLSLRCTYARAFLEEQEEVIGLTWCCWDMGFTPTFHPLFCQYMPRHMLKGDSLCHQIRALAESPEEQKWLNSVEHTGWRSFIRCNDETVSSDASASENASSSETPSPINDNINNITGQFIHRDLFAPLTPAKDYLLNNEAFFAGLHDADGFYDLVQLIAEAIGNDVYITAERVFTDNDLAYDCEEMRTPFRVRRTDYNYMGYNAYNIFLSIMSHEQIPHVRRIYNNSAFLNDADLISDEDVQNFPGDILVACNERNKITGLIFLENEQVKALIFSEGRIHEPTRRVLFKKYNEYKEQIFFTDKRG